MGALTKLADSGKRWGYRYNKLEKAYKKSYLILFQKSVILELFQAKKSQNFKPTCTYSQSYFVRQLFHVILFFRIFSLFFYFSVNLISRDGKERQWVILNTHDKIASADWPVADRGKVGSSCERKWTESQVFRE